MRAAGSSFVGVVLVDEKRCWKNDAKTMTTKMATKSNMDDHGWESVATSKGGPEGGIGPLPYAVPRGRDLGRGKEISRKEIWKDIYEDSIGNIIGNYLLSTPSCPLERAGG